jgi:hypothetical protein
MRTIRENYIAMKLSLEQIISWQTLPEEEVADVSCSKADRKFRASKRGLEDQDSQTDSQLRKEKREKQDLKEESARKKQELLKQQISEMYTSGQVSWLNNVDLLGKNYV